VKPGEANILKKRENPKSFEHDNDEDFVYAWEVYIAVRITG